MKLPIHYAIGTYTIILNESMFNLSMRESSKLAFNENLCKL